MSIVATGPSKGKSVRLQQPRGQARISCPHSVVTGVDKLEVSLHLQISDFEVFERFAALKSEVQQGMQPSIAVNFGSKEFFSWNLKRTGTKLHPFVLRSGDITLLLSPRSHNSSIPNCQIEIGSVSSQEGAFAIYGKILAWLDCYGFSVRKEIVGRVDLAADFIGEDFLTLDLGDEDKWITRARDFNTYSKYRKLTGVSLGSARLMARLYNKSFEVKRDKAKSKFFHELWQCKKGTPVTRVEFQLRRVVLKEFDTSVDTPAELEKNLDSIWQYLTQDWARLSSQKVDRKNKNHKQSPLSPFWKKVQEAIFTVRQHKNWRSIKKNLHKNLEALKDQARGCILNFAAAAGHDVNDFEGIISTCVDVLASDLRDYMRNRYMDYYKLFHVRLNECFVGF